MTRIMLLVVVSASLAFSSASDTNLVDFPFVKQGPIHLYSLTDGTPDGGKDSIAALQGASNHATDSALYDKLIPLSLEVAEATDSGTTYRVSYIGYRENPGFKYMWNSSAFRYAKSHRLDYLTAPIPDGNVSHHVPMTRDLMVQENIYARLLSFDAGLGGNSVSRISLMEYHEGYWGDRFYLGSSVLSVAFLNERGPLRVSANALTFMASSIPFLWQTQSGAYWPLNPGGMHGPLGYMITLLHAAPNAHIIVPLHKELLFARSGINTDYFLNGSPGKVAFGVDAALGIQVKGFNVFAGILNQLPTPQGEATGLRYALSLGVAGFESEKRPYFRR